MWLCWRFGEAINVKLNPEILIKVGVLRSSFLREVCQKSFSRKLKFAD